MKFESVGGLMSGAAASFAATAAHFGATPQAVAVAALGAALAVLEMQRPRKLASVVTLFVFNLVVGVSSAPLVLAQFVPEAGQGALMAVTFLIGYVAHDFFRAARGALRNRLTQKIGGEVK
jgi:hypothetical protein